MIWQNSNRKTGNAQKLAALQKENEALKEQMQTVLATVEKLTETANTGTKK